MTVACSQHGWRAAPGSDRPRSRRCVLRILVAAAACAVLFSGTVMPGRAAAPQAAANPQSFIAALGDEVLAIIKARNLSQAQRQERFRTLFSQNFDVPTIARFVVGRYWNRATDGERQKYVDTFRDYVAAIYADQFSHYQGEGFKTLGGRPLGGDESVVRSVIERQSQPPINVAFRVKGSAGSYKITDVTVENVSLIITKRDEFASLLAEGGIKGVTARMQQILHNTQQAG